jgi:hypothetical protein
MDLQKFTNSLGTWEFSLDAWKRSQDLGTVPVHHSIAADRLEYYLKDKAAVALERYAPLCPHFVSMGVSAC